VQALQAHAPLTEKPKFTIENVAMKIAALDREVKYLVNKMKSFRPKTKPKPTKESNTTESGSNETKTDSTSHLCLIDVVIHVLDICRIGYCSVSLTNCIVTLWV